METMLIFIVRGPAAKQGNKVLTHHLSVLHLPSTLQHGREKGGVVWQSLGQKEGAEMEGGHCVSELDRDQAQRDYCSPYTLQNARE